MMQGLIFQQQQVEQENMSNLTCVSNETTSVSHEANNYPHCAAPTQSQPAVKRKRNLPGNPDPDAEVIALSPKTLLATNRFLCEICNKGFQRDQNLQLHRRGHNLPWKLKQRAKDETPRKKVYVCPEPNCVHNDPARALGDLTGIKKHFFRKHGEKKWKCEKCSKKYAVQSDWKAHSKTCGTREYRCDCGTLFSRRDSFITHRAFCDALAEETSKAIITTTPLEAAAAAFSLKKEPAHHNNLQQLPPWLSAFNHPPLMAAAPPQQQQQHNVDNLNMGPTYSHAAAAMSATALLQKAAQMGSTMSRNGSESSSLMGPNYGHVSNNAGFGLNLTPSRDHQIQQYNNSNNNNISFEKNNNVLLLHGLSSYGNKAAPSGDGTTGGGSLMAAGDDGGGGGGAGGLHKMMMSSLSSNNVTSFEDIFGGGGEGMTRDFLGLRAISHSDILNMAGLGNFMKTSTSDHHNQQQEKPWQG